MGQNGGQRSFVGQHVQHAAADEDGVSHGEALDRRGQQDAAADFGLNVDVIGDFQVIDDRVEDAVDFTGSGQQAAALQALDDVVFGLTLPGALGRHGRQVLRGCRCCP